MSGVDDASKESKDAPEKEMEVEPELPPPPEKKKKKPPPPKDAPLDPPPPPEKPPSSRSSSSDDEKKKKKKKEIKKGTDEKGKKGNLSLVDIGGRTAVVGVDYVNQEGYEAAGVHEAYAFAEAMKDEGYEGEVKTLCDDGTVGRMPTRVNVIEAVEWLIRCSSNTGVVLYFSGRVEGGCLLPADHLQDGTLLITTIVNDLEKRLPLNSCAFIIINKTGDTSDEEAKTTLEIGDCSRVGVMVVKDMAVDEAMRELGEKKTPDEPVEMDPILRRFSELATKKYGKDTLAPFESGGYTTKDYATWATKPLADVQSELQSAGLPVIRAAPLQNLAKDVFTDDVLESAMFDALCETNRATTVAAFGKLLDGDLYGNTDQPWVFSAPTGDLEGTKKNKTNAGYGYTKQDQITEDLISLGVIPGVKPYGGETYVPPRDIAVEGAGGGGHSGADSPRQVDVRIHLHQEKEIVNNYSEFDRDPHAVLPTSPEPLTVTQHQAMNPPPHYAVPNVPEEDTHTHIVHHVWDSRTPSAPPGQSLREKILNSGIERKGYQSAIKRVDDELTRPRTLPSRASTAQPRRHPGEWDGSGADKALLRIRGYIPAGGDLLGSPRFVTIQEARKLCLETPMCVGFSYPGADPAPSERAWMYFKDKAVIHEGDWTTYVKESVPVEKVLAQPLPFPTSPKAEDVSLMQEPPTATRTQPTFAMRKRLIDFYEHYNPSKLPSVPLTLHEYQGKEVWCFCE